MTESFLQLFTANFTILIIRYFVLCGLFFVVFYLLFKKQLAKHKLQNQFPSKTDYLRDILYSLLSALIFGFIFTLTITVFLPFTKIYNNISTFGPAYYVLSYLFMMALHDTYFYWTHRLIHTKSLFKMVHLVHHQSTNPTPWTSLAFHPFEAIIQALIIPLIAVLFPVQKFALIIYFLFQFIHNIYGHLGYELLPAFIRESRFGKYLNTSTVHNKHHKNVRGNYGLYFTIWDRLMGTLKEANQRNC